MGVPIFQEQVMQLAVVAAGFTPGGTINQLLSGTGSNVTVGSGLQLTGGNLVNTGSDTGSIEFAASRDSACCSSISRRKQARCCSSVKAHNARSKPRRR